mmetsp:Transcript_17999/g.37461  ORF Transcript_17999/g.37461 Transcript_17999/m.37461 type:complete len:148 (-) Transcript_17999:169-612(-)
MSRPPSIILCLSPGRCGSSYLSLLFSASDDTISVHEPSPNLSALALLVNDTEIKEAIENKAVHISETISASAAAGEEKKTYVETNHCLLHKHYKIFISAMLDKLKCGDTIGVVVLRRDAVDIVKVRGILVCATTLKLSHLSLFNHLL